MNASNRGFRDKGTHNARHSVMSDGFGNRKTFEEVRIPPDNIGNKLEGEAALDPYIDGLGNSLDDEPSHLKSGILAQVSGPRSYHKRREYSMIFISHSLIRNLVNCLDKRLAWLFPFPRRP
jgi:hypothetical protein